MEQDSLREESSTQSHEYEHYENSELNQSFRREDVDDMNHSASYMMSLDLRAESPQLSIEKVETTLNSLGLESRDEEIDNDLAEIAQQLCDSTGASLPAIEARSGLAPGMGSLYSFGNPNRRESLLLPFSSHFV
jgi:hypothetical protein